MVTSAETDRFWNKVNKDGQLLNSNLGQCWEWTGATSQSSSGPYGKFRSEIAKWPIGAHRVSYYYEYGILSTRKDVLDHLCRNTLCVRPSHLDLIKNAENVARGNSPTALNARKTHCDYGHALVGENVQNNQGKRKCRECHRRIAREWARAHA